MIPAVEKYHHPVLTALSKSKKYTKLPVVIDMVSKIGLKIVAKSHVQYNLCIKTTKWIEQN